MTHQRFLRQASTVCVLLITAVAAANYLLDPYALFGTQRIAGINVAKPMAGTRTKVVKPYQLMREAPKLIIGGNSRPELGIDPANACWGAARQPVYNAGVAGSGIYSQARLLQTAIIAGDVRHVIWGLDFLDFLGRHRLPMTAWPGPGNDMDARLVVTPAGDANRGHHWQRLRDARDALLSLHAFSDSWLTLMSQAITNVSTRRSDGFNPARDYVDIVANEGQFVLFQQKNREVVRIFAHPELTLYPVGERWSLMFESLRRLLVTAARHDVRVTLFVNPYHADYLTAISVADKWRMFNDWKRRLVEISEENDAVALWDFTAFDRYSTDLPPPAGVVGRALDWFWEPAHYRKELGDLMIARMTACGDRDVGFGLRLTTASVAAQAQALEIGLERYLRRYPERAESLRRMIGTSAR